MSAATEAGVQSPGSDVSPRSQVPPLSTASMAQPEYFPGSDKPTANASPAPTTPVDDTPTQTPATPSAGDGPSAASKRENRPRIRIKGMDAPLSRASSTRSVDTVVSRPKITIPESRPAPGRGRKSSVASLSFAPADNPALPQGSTKKTDKNKIRAGSPPPKRFQSHVAFDSLPLGEATKSNTTSLTLNVRHKGYQQKRTSRTFMVGIDEHTYSDYALQWLLDKMVDDGDEVVCVRVVEKESKDTARYLEDAQKLMNRIIEKNGNNRAVSVVLEYAVGKLHSTFQKLIQMYQPGMLVVGTRGRSLGGLQGLMNSRSSFSKYCLQYSPIPVVVVRPTEKREKKKNKRLNDSERQTYVGMLKGTGGRHESDCEGSYGYDLQIHHSADEEAHQVAKALGLPAKFDPTIKPLDTRTMHRTKSAAEPSPLSQSHQTSPADAAAANSTGGQKGTAAGAGAASPREAGGRQDSDDDESDSSSTEDEFEAIPGEQALDHDQQERLHDMEVGEAAALLKQNRRGSTDSAAQDEEDEQHGGHHSRKSSGA